MCISTPGTEEKKLPSGLMLGHAYTITKVMQIQIENGEYSGIHNLVRIRNPWGKVCLLGVCALLPQWKSFLANGRGLSQLK